MKRNKNKNNDTTINNPVLNIVSPQSLSYSTKSLEISGYNARAFGLTKYPAELQYGWLSKITNLDSTITSVSVTPVDAANLLEALNKNIRDRVEDTYSTNSTTRLRAEKSIADSEKMIRQIDQAGAYVCEMAVNYMPVDEDYEKLSRLCRKNNSRLSAMGIRPRVLTHRQDLAFQQCSPSFGIQSDVAQITNRVVPLSTVIGGFPYSSSTFTDSSGDYFGRTLDNNIILLDLWKRGGDRVNSNIVILGQAGSGKSTIIKSIAITEFKNGTKLLFIDPEGEYRQLAHNLGGEVINASGGGTKINPLQVRPIPHDDGDVFGEGDDTIPDLVSHIKSLETFFNLYIPSLTDVQKAILKKCLLKLYNNFGIGWETDISSLKPTDFPIFSDLYELINEEYNREKNEDYNSLALLLSDIASGADSFIWNGHTTLNPKTNCIVLDTSGLQNVSDEVKRTQYYNLLSWCWEQMSRDRNEQILLFADEAYLMIDPKVPQSLAFLRNTEKRCRKYTSAIAIIAHSIVDFLDPSVKMYGQALLDIPCYKFLFGADGENLRQQRELFNLTQAEEELLLKKERGKALAIIGSKRIAISFILPQYRLDLMGSSGGR